MYFDISKIDLEKHPECKDLPLVVKIAKRVHRLLPMTTVGIDDLINVGWIVLQRCRDTYKPELGTYQAYVGKALKREFLQTLEQAGHFKVSRTTRWKLYRLKKKNKPLPAAMKRVDKTLSMERSQMPLDVATREREPDYNLELADDVRKLNMEMRRQLSERDRTVLFHYYGLGVPAMSLTEISHMLPGGLTRAATSFIHRTAINRLREAFDCPN